MTNWDRCNNPKGRPLWLGGKEYGVRGNLTWWKST